MIGTIIIAILIVSVGTRATDAVRLRQQEIILSKLPVADAAAYYRILRRRAWTTRVLRAVALVSLVVILYARNRGWQRDHRNSVAPGPGRVAETQPAVYLAQRR